MGGAVVFSFLLAFAQGLQRSRPDGATRFLPFLYGIALRPPRCAPQPAGSWTQPPSSAGRTPADAGRSARAPLGAGRKKCAYPVTFPFFQAVRKSDIRSLFEQRLSRRNAHAPPPCLPEEDLLFRSCASLTWRRTRRSARSARRRLASASDVLNAPAARRLGGGSRRVTGPARAPIAAMRVRLLR